MEERQIEKQAVIVKEQQSEMDKPDDFTDPQILYRKLIAEIRSYHPSADISLIEKAYCLAYEAHKNQFRKSGEPYIIHPLCVCLILAELELDKETIVAGLLHDVVEDTIYTLEEIEEEFSPEIALLVDGVTKLTQLNYSKDKVEVQAENLRKMFLAMAKDIRVIIIKLADRLHNMRTMQYQTPDRQVAKSRETMDIYAPIAQRLGISKIKIELDNLSLFYLEPEVYTDLTAKIDAMVDQKEEFIKNIVDEVGEHIQLAGIDANISGRVKHLFSIYKKMVNQNKTLEQIYDLFAVRIRVDSVKDCYAALGIIHEMYKPIPGRFKDYIAMPKPNMYQSLHTTLIGPEGTPFEIQIRTYEMHRTAEYGIAAHWKYKESQDGRKSIDNEEAKLTWLHQILEWQREMSDNREFLSLIKNDLDLFSESVHCFTPSGDVKTFPNGSTPIDFAYSIHSAVGNKMVGARVNGKLVTIDYVIQNGDRIEIITSQNCKGPSRDWLSIVKSTQAKNKINQWFKTELKEDNIIRGKELLVNSAKAKGYVLSDLTKPEWMKKTMNKYGFRDWEAVCAAIGHGSLKESQIVNKLHEEYLKEQKKTVIAKQSEEVLMDKVEARPVSVAKSKSGIVVEGINDIAVRFSKCCTPVPGDEIVGFVTRGRGVSIHRTDCVNIINLAETERARLIDAQWQEAEILEKELYTAELMIYARNESGVLFQISKVFTENNLDVSSMNVRTSKQGTATIAVSFPINGVDHLNTLIQKLRTIDTVIDIERTSG